MKRCYIPNVDKNLVSLQIHGFGDSSEVAYAAVVYFRIETSKGAYTRLIMSKTRVAPLAKQTIPRLELLAALILSRLVVSDNAKTFKTAARFLSSIFELPEVQRFLLNHKVKWKFNLERAPWWDGFFERMVRCVKRCLKKILKNAKLTYEELLTLVVEIECVLNSRPLTYVSSQDRVEPLTPSHLLTGRRLLSIPDESIVAEEESSEVEILTRRQRRGVARIFP